MDDSKKPKVIHGTWFSTLKAAHECLVYGVIVFYASLFCITLVSSPSSIGDAVELIVIGAFIAVLITLWFMFWRASANNLAAPIKSVALALILCVGGFVFYVAHPGAREFMNDRFMGGQLVNSSLRPGIVVGFLWIYASFISGFILVQCLSRKVALSGVTQAYLAVAALMAVIIVTSALIA